MISFIGRGIPDKKTNRPGDYVKTVYELPDGSKKETTLITSALYDYLKPDKLILIGTPGSIWIKLEELIKEDELFFFPKR